MGEIGKGEAEGHPPVLAPGEGEGKGEPKKTGHRFQPGNVKSPLSGRKPGTPNKSTGEVKEFCQRLVSDPAYTTAFEARFKAGKLHPSVERMVWYYAAGKPRERLDINHNITVQLADRLAEARLRRLQDTTTQPTVIEAKLVASAALPAHEPSALPVHEQLTAPAGRVNVAVPVEAAAVAPTPGDVDW